MTLQEIQADLFCPCNSTACRGGARDHKALRACVEPSPEPEGWPGTAAPQGQRERVGAQWSLAHLRRFLPSQYSSHLVPQGEPPGAGKLSHAQHPCFQDSRREGVVRPQRLQPQDCHDQTHQRGTGRGPSTHSLLVPASPETTQKSVLSLLCPSCLEPLFRGL